MRSEELYTVREASELQRLGLKYWTLWDLLKKGRLVRTKVGHRTYIRRSEVERLIEERTRIIDMPRGVKKSPVGKRG